MRVLLLAGELSGVQYADGIAERLRARVGSVEIRGYQSEGYATSDLAVMGFWPVLRRIFFFLRVKRTMERVIDAWRPDVVCTVDYPGLNLKLAAYAKARGIRAVHVVSPQVWAWKKGRIPKIEASLDRLCCFFPFEPALFRPGLGVFVGHPLAYDFAPLERTPPTDARRLVAVLPGSRMGEIDKILPTLLTVVERLVAKYGEGVRCVIPAAGEQAERRIRELVAQLPEGCCEVRCGGARALLLQADCAVVASGTATLEAALALCPTVLVYRVSAALAAFARWAIRDIRHVGLANIVAEKTNLEPPMPELLQEAFTADAVFSHLDAWLTNPAARRETVDRLAAVVATLKTSADPLSNVVDSLAEPLPESAAPHGPAL